MRSVTFLFFRITTVKAHSPKVFALAAAEHADDEGDNDHSTENCQGDYQRLEVHCRQTERRSSLSGNRPVLRADQLKMIFSDQLKSSDWLLHSITASEKQINKKKSIICDSKTTIKTTNNIYPLWYCCRFLYTIECISEVSQCCSNSRRKLCYIAGQQTPAKQQHNVRVSLNAWSSSVLKLTKMKLHHWTNC